MTYIEVPFPVTGIDLMWQATISESCALSSPGLLGVCSGLGLLLEQWVQQPHVPFLQSGYPFFFPRPPTLQPHANLPIGWLHNILPMFAWWLLSPFGASLELLGLAARALLLRLPAGWLVLQFFSPELGWD